MLFLPSNSNYIEENGFRNSDFRIKMTMKNSFYDYLIERIILGLNI